MKIQKLVIKQKSNWHQKKENLRFKNFCEDILYIVVQFFTDFLNFIESFL